MNVSRIIKSYRQVFGTKPAAVAHAPGRVNLIGEHVDYNAGVTLLLIPSGVKHSLANGEYEQRVHACQEAVRGIAADNPDVQTLRDVSEKMLEAHHPRLTPVCRRRARYVVTELDRVTAAVEATAASDWPRLGGLL